MIYKEYQNFKLSMLGFGTMRLPLKGEDLDSIDEEEVAKNTELRARFTEAQLADIENIKTPKGYTWHHSEITGQMELVEEYVHQKTKHDGGYSIWGKGSLE